MQYTKYTLDNCLVFAENMDSLVQSCGMDNPSFVDQIMPYIALLDQDDIKGFIDRIEECEKVMLRCTPVFLVVVSNDKEKSFQIKVTAKNAVLAHVRAEFLAMSQGIHVKRILTSDNWRYK